MTSTETLLRSTADKFAEREAARLKRMKAEREAGRPHWRRVSYLLTLLAGIGSIVLLIEFPDFEGGAVPMLLTLAVAIRQWCQYHNDLDVFYQRTF